MTTTRCKFKVESVTDHGGGKRSVQMNPVYSADPNSENKTFWESTPSGNIQFQWINDRVQFTPGKEYYIDIAEAPAPATT